MKNFAAPPDTWERIHLNHETRYSYLQPVKFLPHRVVLRPREGHDVRLHSMNLTTSPASSIRWSRYVLDYCIASGSCRDMAVLMIEVSRSLGYPARFVSAYMESNNSKVGRGSTHG